MSQPIPIILGSGPAGLIAANTIEYLTGIQPLIFSTGVKSTMYGAQFLHEPIYGTVPRTQTIWFHLKGTIDGYREKVYGMESDVEVSPETFTDTMLGFDIRETYDWLWNRWNKPQHYIPWTANHKEVSKLAAKAKEDGRLVISTIPAQLLCDPRSGHYFESQSIWAIGDAPDRGQLAPVRPGSGSFIYNGEKYPSWYRAANVFGHCTVEWPGAKRPPVSGVVKVSKPLSTNCDCAPNIVRAGRYGEWKKGRLVHEVQGIVEKALWGMEH